MTHTQRHQWSTITTPSSKWDPPGKVFKSWQQVHLVNKGTANAYNVIATITCKPANVQVKKGAVSFGNIPAGNIAWITDDFELWTDMTNPQPSNKAIVWKIEYDDAPSGGNHYVINNIPYLCGQTINCP